MKCPKCGYLGFKHVERCPNCGYDFSLSSSPALLDLTIRPSSQNTPRPLADLALVDSGLSLSSPPAPQHGATPELGSVPIAGAPAPTPELPLFRSPLTDDVPLITRPSPPRTPLAVRRATPEVPRLRSDGRGSNFEFGPTDGDSKHAALSPQSVRRAIAVPAAQPPQAETGDRPAAVTARALAAILDVALLAAIDVAVVYFTMQIVGVAFDEVAILPKVPLIAFLIVQNVGYFVFFTAGGQTMGQMALGIKVISDEAGASPDLPHAMLRTMIWTVMAVPAGLGLATALFSRDRRALHDRFSGTRVVRAGA